MSQSMIMVEFGIETKRRAHASDCPGQPAFQLLGGPQQHLDAGSLPPADDQRWIECDADRPEQLAGGRSNRGGKGMHRTVFPAVDRVAPPANLNELLVERMTAGDGRGGKPGQLIVP